MSRTKGSESYTFTYTDFLKVATISRNGQVLHRFGYDANGVRVAERRSDGTLVFFVGEYYEYNVLGAAYEQVTTKFHDSVRHNPQVSCKAQAALRAA